MSLNEIAVDLTCEPEEFQPAATTAEEREPVSGVPGGFPPIDTNNQSGLPPSHASPNSYAFPTIPNQPQVYQVHSGMLRMARAMGEIGKPVHLAVHEALQRNPDYGTLRSHLSI
jgi:sn1-specific diacylglycerol lipase